MNILKISIKIALIDIHNYNKINTKRIILSMMHIILTKRMNNK